MIPPAFAMLAGTAMFILGLIMFYSVEMGQTETSLRIIKNAGIFVGLIGVGAAMAGILLLLMNEREPIRS